MHVQFDTRMENKNNKNERHFRLERVYPIQKEVSATGASIKLPNQFGTETSYDNSDITNNQKSQISLPSEYNMQQNEKKIPAKESFETKIQEKVEKQTQNKGIEALKKATNTGKNYLQLKQSEVKQLREDLRQYVGKTKEQLTNSKTYNNIKDTVRQFMEKEIEHLDYDMKQVKNQIRNTNIKVDSNLKNQITDYNDFKKTNFGKLKLGNIGQSIDSVYQETI